MCKLESRTREEERKEPRVKLEEHSSYPILTDISIDIAVRGPGMSRHRAAGPFPCFFSKSLLKSHEVLPA